MATKKPKSNEWPTPEMVVAGECWRVMTQERGMDPLTLAIRIGLLTSADVMSFMALMLATTAKEMEAQQDEAVAAAR